MNNRPDIVLTGRYHGSEERILSLFEYKIYDTKMIFKYRFNDWSDGAEYAYFILHDNEVYFNRDAPIIVSNDTVSNQYRSYAYSRDEILAAIQGYLVEKFILMEC